MAAILGGVYGVDYSSRKPVEPEAISCGLISGMRVKLENPNWSDAKAKKVRAMVLYNEKRNLYLSPNIDQVKYPSRWMV